MIKLSSFTGLLAAALIAGVGLAVAAQPDAVRVYTMSPGRIAASSAAVLGLIGAVSGKRALTRSANRTSAPNARRGAVVALMLGAVGLLVGGLVVATAKGGIGTGNGLGGGVVAIVIGGIGTALGGLALARSRRAVIAPSGNRRSQPVSPD